MSLAPLEHGASLRRQFKKAEVAAGSLKGARYLDVGWEDLKKAAKSYKSDPRFNQFAKRCVSERALASEGAHVDAQEGNSDGHAGVRLGSICKRVMSWTFCKAKGRIALFVALAFLCLLILSRPKFYILVGKSLTLGVRLALRRSFGMITLILDAILDEAVESFEQPGLIAPVQVGNQIQQQHDTSNAWLLHVLCGVIGALMGRQLPRGPNRSHETTGPRTHWTYGKDGTSNVVIA